MPAYRARKTHGNSPKGNYRGSKGYWKIFERYVAQKFQRWFPQARRGLQFQQGEYCPDIVNTPWYIECKYSATQVSIGKKRYNQEKPDKVRELMQYYIQREKLWQEDRAYMETKRVVLVYRIRLAEMMVILPRSLARDLNLWDFEVDAGDFVTVTWANFEKSMDHHFEVLKEKPKRVYKRRKKENAEAA